MLGLGHVAWAGPPLLGLGHADSLEVGRSDGDHAGKSRMLSHIVKIGRFARAAVEERFDSGFVGARPIFVLFCPDGVVCHDKGVALGVKRVGHPVDSCKEEG